LLTFVLKMSLKLLSSLPLLLFDLLPDRICHILHASRNLCGPLVPLSLPASILRLIQPLLLLSETHIFSLFL
jgi:hypothetical protein